MVSMKVGENEVINLAYPRGDGRLMDALGAGVRLARPAGIAGVNKNRFPGRRDDQGAGAPFHIGPIDVESAGGPRGDGGGQG